MKRLSLFFNVYCIVLCIQANSNSIFYKEYSDFILTHLLTPAGPIPTVYDPNGVYPYMSYSETSNRPSIKQYRFVSLENDYLKVVICPDLGGKIMSMIHKSSNKEVLYVPEVIRATRILPRFYFVAGGIEVSFPISHTPTQNESVSYKIDETIDRIYITCGERELRFGMQWSVEYSLGKKDKYLTQRTVFHNPGNGTYPWMSWSNAAIPSAPDTQYDFPNGKVLRHASTIDSIDWATSKIKTESDIKEMTGYFWQTKNVNAFGVFTPSLGIGLYHIADPKITGGIKLWSYGIGKDEPWAILSTAKKQPYAEIQGGPIADQSMKLELKSKETHWHTEYWIPTDEKLDLQTIKNPANDNLRPLSQVPMFEWARKKEINIWDELNAAYKSNTKPPQPPSVAQNLWTPSGMENLDKPFLYAIEKSERDTKVLSKVGKNRPVQTTSAHDSINALARFGGFSFLESAVDGIAAMSPERSARKKAFLNDNDKKEARENLENNINLWLELLSSTSSMTEMLDKATQKAENASQLLSKNQLTAVGTVKNLEQSYRNVMLFYKNTESDKLTNVSIVNASRNQITDLDNSRFIDHISNELKQNFDKLDLRMNYSLLVVPGYLGATKVVDKWSKIAYENKAMLYTDFMDLENPDDVVEMFFTSGLAGGDAYKANTSMACNWLIGRGKYSEIGEEEDLHVSPGAALAGKVYTTLMSQITAGKKYGGINEVDSVVFPLKKSEISQLDKMGLIPMVNEYGKVMAFSGKTLFNGDNLGLQTYSVVRVFDYITKVLFDFLNRRAFENWSGKTERDLRGQIIKFLDGVQGPDRLIEKFKIVRFERDPNQKDRIYLDIHLTPYFPAKSFVIKLDGTKGEEENTWNSEVEQQ